MKLQSYNDCLTYLNSLYSYEKNAHRISPPPFHLEKIAQVMDSLGNVHHSYRVVHIAGTKGKGSCAAMVTSILKSAGAKVGTYTSPHLVDLRERICIDGEPISEELFVSAVDGVRSVIGERPKEYATFFEVLTASAFLAFHNADVDIAVVEAGLGGKFDATNIVIPDVAVLTRIGFDHTERLGNTIQEIAADKSGIIKNGCRVVVGKQEAEAITTILEIARQKKADVSICGRDFSFEIVKKSIQETALHIYIPPDELSVHLPLVGGFQAENAATAAMTAHTIGIDGEDIVSGLEKTHLRGRMDVLRGNPLIIADGAHNPTAAATISREVLELGLAPIVMVVGINSPKNFEKMLQSWAKVAKSFVFTSSGSPRSYSPDMLTKYAENSLGVKSIPVNEPIEALGKAVKMAGENGKILITGSLYLVGEILRTFLDCDIDAP